MFPKNPEIVNKLKPYLGLKGKKLVNKMPFTITENERGLNLQVHGDATIKSFDKL
jgi:hypothetical protein